MLRKLILAGFLALLASPSFAASAYITEFATMAATDSGGAPAQIATLPPITHQKVDFSGGAVSASAFNSQTRFIRVHCDAACSIRVNNTATITYLRIPTDGVEYFGVKGGDFLSVIANP